MKRILLDTNSYVAFKRNDSFAINIIRRVEFIGMNIIVFAELLSGFKGGSKENQNRKELDQFLNSPRVHFFQIDEETAEFYAKIFWDLKTDGRPIPSNDIWIAASAMRYGLALFSFDKHFEYIKGLTMKEQVI